MRDVREIADEIIVRRLGKFCMGMEFVRADIAAAIHQARESAFADCAQIIRKHFNHNHQAKALAKRIEQAVPMFCGHPKSDQFEGSCLGCEEEKENAA